jgi:hypothetical protein
MARYYFDMREGDQIAPDEEGMELRTMEAVQEEAARTLADMAEMPCEAAPTDRDTRCRLRSETRPGR